MILEITRICLVMVKSVISYLFLKEEAVSSGKLYQELYAFSNCSKIPYNNINLERSMKIA